MTPEVKTIEKEPEKQEVQVQETFIRQVQDHSRAADEVLTDQREACAPNDRPALFVP
jgi:hypothetical protein